MEHSRPKVAISAVLVRSGKVLLGKRKGAHGAGEWSFPGGHLEYGEGWEECARRETKEETGLVIEKVKFVGVTNSLFPEDHKHYITILMAGECAAGEPKQCEPDQCEGWEWFDWDNLPTPRFSAINELKAMGFNPNTL